MLAQFQRVQSIVARPQVLGKNILVMEACSRGQMEAESKIGRGTRDKIPSTSVYPPTIYFLQLGSIF
jgi:hypothetical protein